MIDQLILSHLLLNPEFGSKVVPFLKPEYFQNPQDRKLFNLISAYTTKYSAFPTKEALFVNLGAVTTLNESEYQLLQKKIDDLSIEDDTDSNWLLDKTEEFCSDQAIKNALFKSIQIWEGKDKKLDKGSIPQILSDALAVSFDTNIGHDFTEDWELRYEKYHNKLERVPFGIHMLDKVSEAGAAKRTLTIFMGATGIGKTIVLCSLASSNLTLGKNVLYITLEMGEVGVPSISHRIDANLLDTPTTDLMILPLSTYKSRIERMREKIKGKLIIKEYPMSTANVNNFRFLLNELKLKSGFVPDIIYIDYINICTSVRVKQTEGSYGYIKAITEEFVGLAQQQNVPLISATQLNRQGSASSEPTMTDVAESYGLTHPADMIMAITQNADMKALNQYQIIQVKNRFRDENENRKFVIGVDKSKMRLYDVEQSAQNLSGDMDKPKPSKFGFQKEAFSNFK